jgi:glycerate-2-kinase
MGLDPAEALSRNDSLAVFGAVGGALETGPTGTNVNDLYVAVRVR